MHAKLFQLKCFITYWLDAVDEHSLHSPFLFDFYNKFLKRKNSLQHFDSLRKVRKNLQRNHRIVHVTDLGAGSFDLKTSDRKISDIASVSSTPEKFSILYSNIIRHHQYHHILELGTSLGINTLYLAKAHESVRVVTFEGSSEIVREALQLFRENQAMNIQLMEGNIDQALPVYLTTTEKIDFALIDANHRFEPTLQYFEWLLRKTHFNSIIVIDDIHYSPEMERAWHVVQAHELVHATIDLYRCGLVFFNPSLTKQNVVLQF